LSRPSLYQKSDDELLEQGRGVFNLEDREALQDIDPERARIDRSIEDG
jgi:hypothetical protein